MRKNRLLTATALSLTLTTLGLAGQGLAATSISTATTAPVNTTTTGDLTVETAGKITLTTGTAITVNSNNDVTVNGTIDMNKSADGSTAILIDGGRTADITVSGVIAVRDDYTATDTANSDGILDGPYAQGTARYGIRSTGTTPLIGNVDIKKDATIAVEGNQSYGIRFENNVQGKFTMDGTIAMAGDQNVGVSLEKGATDMVYLSGTITSRGTGSSAVRLSGEFDNTVIIDGSYTGTGYATIDTVNAEALKKILATPSDMGQGGVLVDISGNVDKGIIIGATQANNIDTDTGSADSNPDEDGDGLTDTSQSRADLNNYAAAPALRIASATQDLTIGGLVYATATGNPTPPSINYALSIRGNITGNGVYSGVNGTGVQLGGLGKDVDLLNGVQVKGVVIGQATGGTGTGLLMAAGADTPLLDVSGAIRGVATRALASTTSGSTTSYTVTPGTAIAVDIAAGARLPQINVKVGGSIYANSSGSTNTSIAIRDRSNTLTSITNNGAITGSNSATDDNEDGFLESVTDAHRGIAIDARTNTVGLTLTQVDTAPGDTDADKAIVAPSILGDIWLGSGNDVISASGGSIQGNIDFGAGTNTFTLTNNAAYLGKMSGSGTVALTLNNSVAFLSAGTHLNTSTVTVGATSSLGLALDVDNPTVPILTGTGAVTFADGAILGLKPNKLITAPTTFTVLTASSINLGNVAASLDNNTSFIYRASLSKNTENTALYAGFRLKTQEEGGFSSNQYAALVPVLTAAGTSIEATADFMSTSSKESFDRLFNQYLPDHSGENVLGLSLGSASLNRSLGSLSLIPTNGAGQYWLQEYGYHTEREYGDTNGFKSTGFSFAGGRESEIYGNQTVGVYLSYTSATPADEFAISAEEMINSDVTVGGYWRLRTGAFKGWVHGGLGFTNFESVRQNASLSRTSEAKWSGMSYSGGAGASIDYKLGGFGVTPMVLADYYSLSEEAHSETGGGDSFNLNIDKRDSHLLSTTAMFNFSYGRFFLQPELWVGYKQNISADIADTVAHFNNGTPFSLNSGNLEGGGPIAGFRLSADNEWSYFGIEGDYFQHDSYTNYSLSLRTRFQF